MPNPSDLARMAALSANRRFQLKRDRRSDQDAVGPSTNAIYQGYDADTEQHLTNQGRSGFNLSNAGIDAGQRIEWSQGTIDSMPRVRLDVDEDPVLPGDDPIWAAAFTRAYYEGNGQGGSAIYSRKVWFCSSSIAEPQLIFTAPPVELSEGDFYETIAPQILVWLSYDPLQDLIHLDIKVQQYTSYYNPESVATSGLYGQLNMQKHHWQISGSNIVDVPASEAWRAPYTNSPNNTPLQNPNNFPSCLSYLWSDEVIYTPDSSVQEIDPEAPIDHQYRHFDNCYNYLDDRNQVYVGRTATTGGSPGGGITSALISGKLRSRIFQVEADSCQGITPPGQLNSNGFIEGSTASEIGLVEVNFAPIDLSGTLVSGLGDIITVSQNVNAASYIVYER